MCEQFTHNDGESNLNNHFFHDKWSCADTKIASMEFSNIEWKTSKYFDKINIYLCDFSIKNTLLPKQGKISF